MADAICSQCPARAVGRSGMCPSCWAAYMRDYRKREKIAHDRRAFIRGAQEMRAACVKQMREVGPGEMNGYTAATILQDLELPTA